jgi:capsule biosynthesis phosphatase
MNIIIPLGGRGERFKDQDYKLPKILIPVLGKEIIFWVIENLKISSKDCITIIYNNELENFRLEDRLRKRFDHNFHFIKLPFQTNGPVETILYGLNKLPKKCLDEQLLIHDGDSIIKKNVLAGIKPNENKIFYTLNTDPKPIYSYIKLNDDGDVIEVEEKKKISDNANVGCFVFSSGHTFIKYGERLNTESMELYVSYVFKKLLEDGVKVGSSQVLNEDFICFGTPNQIVDFSTSNVDNPKRFCFDLDNTLVTYPKVKNDYTTVEPIEKNIRFLKYLKSKNHTIIIFTARRMLTHKGNVSKVIADVGKITLDTLDEFDIPYDEIHFGKPHADFYIDDLVINSFDNLEKETGFYVNNVDPRSFNNIEFKENTIIKTSESSLAGEINFYLNYQPAISKYFPKLICWGPNKLEIEKIEGNLLSKMYCHKLLTTNHIDMLFEALNDIHASEFKKSDSTNMPSIYSNYSSKLHSRYIAYDYSKFQHSKDIYKRIDGKLVEYERLQMGKQSVIHGDFVFSNIFLTVDNNLKFIDMRGKLGEDLSITGDMFYDYAKMYQSLIGYDFILNDATPVFFYIKQNVDHFEKKFVGKFGQERFEYLKYLTASLLFTLLPLHNNKKCVDYYNLIEYLI